MFLVKFRATEKDQWSPVGASSYIVEEYVDTDSEGYAQIRALQAMENELEEEIDKYKISLITVKKLKVIK